jgi:hypothetical protein
VAIENTANLGGGKIGDALFKLFFANILKSLIPYCKQLPLTLEQLLSYGIPPLLNGSLKYSEEKLHEGLVSTQ